MRIRKSTTVFLGMLFVMGGVAAGCSDEGDDGSLRLLTPGSTVYLNAWDPDADTGDEALVERKPSGMWVLPEDAPFRFEPDDTFTVKVTLDPDAGTFVVKDMGGTKVGLDHDDCLANNEVYAIMDVPNDQLVFEQQRGGADSSNDDCERGAEE